eukprot:6135248-Lingulodinium_polyedra.AAC.1
MGCRSSTASKRAGTPGASSATRTARRATSVVQAIARSSNGLPTRPPRLVASGRAASGTAAPMR